MVYLDLESTFYRILSNRSPSLVNCFSIFVAFAKNEDGEQIWSVWSHIVALLFYYNRTQKKVMGRKIRDKRAKRKVGVNSS